MNEQPLKTSGADPPLCVRGLSAKNMYSHCYYLIMFGDVTNLQQRHNPLNIPHVVEKIKSNPLKGKSFRNRQDNVLFGVLYSPMYIDFIQII